MTAAAVPPQDTDTTPPPLQAVQDTPADQVGHAPTQGGEVVQFRPRNSVTSKLTYARALADSGLLPQAYRGRPANVLFAMEFGEMLGLAPMAAITGVHIIEGKPSASAALISALVRRAGHRLRVQGNDQQATAIIVRSDDPEFEFRSVWTMERAKQAGLVGKDVWRKYPAAMLKARAITEAARDACEEALSGMHYTPEELGADNVDEDGIPTGVTVEHGTLQRDDDQPAPEPDEAAVTAAIAGCATKDDFTALWKSYPRDSKARDRVAAAASAHAAAAVAAKNDTAREMAEESGYAPAPTRPRAAADPEGEVVDAEIVEDEPPAAQQEQPHPDTLAVQCVETLLTSRDEGEIGGIAATLVRTPKVANRNISSELTERARPGVAAELKLDPTRKITVAELAAAALGYVRENQYSVANGVALASEQVAS